MRHSPSLQFYIDFADTFQTLPLLMMIDTASLFTITMYELAYFAIFSLISPAFRRSPLFVSRDRCEFR